VTRTLSKAFGMAAIRTGFLVSNGENMKKLKAQFVPYAMNSVSMKIASVVLRHGDEAGKQIETIKAERKHVYEALKDHPKIEIHNSEANFLYGFSKEKDAMLELLKEAGVTIRNYKGTDAFRITIGKKEENDIVLKALAEFGEGL
jgi:histidinol-phosphate aminotransferase